MRSALVTSALLVAGALPSLNAQTRSWTLPPPDDSVAATLPIAAQPTAREVRVFRRGALIGAGVGALAATLIIITADCSNGFCPERAIVAPLAVLGFAAIGGGIAILIDARRPLEPASPRPRPPRVHLGVRLPL